MVSQEQEVRVIREHREAFNQHWSVQRHLMILDRLRERVGGETPFRIAESPLFLPRPLLDEMDAASRAIVEQVIGNASYRAACNAIVGPERLYPGEDAHPLFMVFDYGLARAADGGVKPMLTEFQGFPSLYAFQHFLSSDFQEIHSLDPQLTHVAGGLDGEGFRKLFRRAILGDHAPETVALLDVSPWQQGTWPDFRLTERICPGLAVLCASDLRRRGQTLYYESKGREIPLKRVYNRVVWEDLARLETELHWSFHDTLDVEWAGHPNWFFRFSKLALPWLKHPNVPPAHVLDPQGGRAWDLSKWILKPLFSFGSRGVVLDLDHATLDRIPVAERGQYVLQQKFEFADVMTAPDGTPIRTEVRLMYVWLDEPVCVGVLPRMSKGRLMGCDHNRTEPWTGHGVAFWPTA